MKIISNQIRVRHPEHFLVGEDSIIDDFCYFSTRVRVGRCSHIASGCSVAGGVAQQFELADFSSVSAGVRIWCTSDDFVNDLVTIIPPGVDNPKEHLIVGDVSIGRCAAIGANTVIMPDNQLPEGTAIGALSFVPPRFHFEPWSVYAGTPIRRLGGRNKDAVLRQLDRLERSLQARSPR